MKKSLKISRGGYEKFKFPRFFQIDNVPELGELLFFSLKRGVNVKLFLFANYLQN